MSTKLNQKKIDSVIQKNLKLLRKPGVMTARPGFKMTGGWITDKPAIVVTVDKKKKGLNNKQKLPAEINNISLDVREATGMQCLRAWWPEDFKLAMLHGRPEQIDPDWKFERNVPTGKLLGAAPSISAKTISNAPTVKSVKQQIKYTAPALPLKKFTGNMTILACASPDDGFTVLHDFLIQTKSDLNIAMYDFTSGELLDTITGLVKSSKVKFQMVLDHPPRNQTANQTDDVTKKDIQIANPKASINWALTRNDPVVNEWIFPSAYHIKVVVRDEKEFWLSSGNFNVSNQPDLIAGVPSKGSLNNADRDWHVIVMNEEIAKLFGTYINNDFTLAGKGQDTGNVQQYSMIRKAMVNLQKMTSKQTVPAGTGKSAHPFTLGKKKVFTNVPVSVQPLLTPDSGKNTTMYVDNVLQIIQSANRSVYMQTQYIHPSDKPADKDFMLLVEALSNAHKKGLDVRVITSQFENTAQWIEKLKPFDLDQVLRIQARVHNKGIVVDSKTVMISSQNWSSDGTLRNRDAGLIIENDAIAKYFEAIFLDDWVNRAIEKIADTSSDKSSRK